MRNDVGADKGELRDAARERRPYLQADDTTSRFHLLLIKRPLLLVCILHSDVDLHLAALSLGLREKTNRLKVDAKLQM